MSPTATACGWSSSSSGTPIHRWCSTACSHILVEFLDFQEEVIARRTRYDLRQAQERAHLLEGLLIAEDNIDAVIQTIRESYDDAKENLMNRFGLSDVQAQAILDMQLKRLQGLEKEKLQTE